MYEDDEWESLYELYPTLRANAVSYLANFAAHSLAWLTCYVLTCALIYWYASTRRRWRRPRGSTARRALLVTAHPDDECMFFGPTVRGLLEDAVDVHILCLSNGDSEGLGDTRQQELWRACVALGVPLSNICLVRDDRLPDSMTVLWPPAHVAKIILQRLEIYDIDVLITFDRHGVSGHTNHSSLFYAVASLFMENKIPQNCSVYTLDSVNVLRKYWSYLDLPLSYMLSSDWYLLSWRQSGRVVHAMRQHRSQLVWFRRLYVLFSRYMLINTLRQVTLIDIELELAVDE